MSQIPGLFLQQGAAPIAPLEQRAASDDHAPSYATGAVAQPPVAFSSTDLDFLRSVMQATSAAQAPTPNTISQAQNNTQQQIDALLVSSDDDTDQSREDGELSDAPPGLSPNLPLVGGRKRKATDSPDHRDSKLPSAPGFAAGPPQAVQASHIVSTLLNNGFPFDQLVQDIYGITLARRQQVQPSTQLATPQFEPSLDGTSSINPSLNAHNHMDITPTDVNVAASKEMPPSVTFKNSAKGTEKAPQAKPVVRDPKAYRAQLEAFKKAAAPPVPKVVTPAMVAIGNKLDREKLKAKIAALRAENAKKVTQPPESQVADESPSVTFSSPGPSISTQARPTKTRVSALELIEASTGSEKSPDVDKTPFVSPMGIDREDSMIIEASSSEESDEDSEDETAGESSDKLTGLESDIARFKARIAAKMLKRRPVGSTSATPKESSEEPMGESSIEDAEAMDLVADLETPAKEVTMALTPAIRSAMLVGDGSIAASATSLDLSDGADNDEDAGLPASSTPADQSQSELPVVEGDLSVNADATGNIEEDDGYVSDDDAPMSMSSEAESPLLSTEPTTTRHASVDQVVALEDSVAESSDSDSSASMDISRGSSEESGSVMDIVDEEDDAAALDAANIQHAPAETLSTNSDSEADSEDDHEPELTGMGNVERRTSGNHSDGESSVGSPSSGSDLDEAWRMHPVGAPSSGVKIWHESGAVPETEKAVDETMSLRVGAVTN